MIDRTKTFLQIKVGLIIRNETCRYVLEKFLTTEGFNIVFSESELKDSIFMSDIDVIILDPGERTIGELIIQEIRQKITKAKIMLYTAISEKLLIHLQALADYYTNEKEPSAVVKGILELANFDQEYIENTITRLRVKFNSRSGLNKLVLPLDKNITDLEKQILECYRIGKIQNEEIAATLCISVNTVKTYKTALCKKLGIQNNKESIITYIEKLFQND